jgi:hypothetical protein
MCFAPREVGVMCVGHLLRREVVFFERVVADRAEGFDREGGRELRAPGVRSSDRAKVKRKGAIPAERFEQSAAKEMPCGT